MNEILHPNYPITIEEFKYRYWELGQSMEYIAKSLNGYGGALGRIVRRVGLETKTRRQAYDDYCKSRKGRIYTLNDSFFDSWSPAMAWVVGLIASDGYIHNKEKKWHITMADKECLQKVAEAISYNGPIYDKPNSTCYVLQVSNVFQHRALRNLGLKPNKSLTLEYPPVPPDYHRHFVRGYFDGDGSISINLIESEHTRFRSARATITTGSLSFAQSLMAVLENEGLKPTLHSRKQKPSRFGDELRVFKNPIHRVRLTSGSTARFYEYIYDDVPENFSLSRKRAKYQAWYNEFGHVYINGPGPATRNPRPHKRCSIAGCRQLAHARELCNLHYKRLLARHSGKVPAT